MILALDTTTRTGSVAVVDDDGGVVYEVGFSSERSHNSALFGPLREALQVAGNGLKAMVVGTGPGSYTGARVGISAALGVCMAEGIPLLGRPSLLALVQQNGVPLPSGLLVGDARRGFWYTWSLEGAEVSLHGDLDLCLISEAERDVIAGEALVRGAALVSVESSWEVLGRKTQVLMPVASELARPFILLSREQLVQMGCSTPEPIYLQAPYVTLPKCSRVS